MKKRIKVLSHNSMLLLVILLTIIALVGTVSFLYSKDSTTLDSQASIPDPCKICNRSKGTCERVASPPNCSFTYNECNKNSECGGTDGGGGNNNGDNGNYSGMGYSCKDDCKTRRVVINGYQMKTSCQESCSNNSRSNPECKKGTFNCPGNGRVQKCYSGKWVDYRACSNCSTLKTNTSFTCNSARIGCVVGEKKCLYPNSKQILICTSNGVWHSENCPDELPDATGACTPDPTAHCELGKG